MKTAIERSISGALIVFFGFGLLLIAASMAVAHAEHRVGCEFSLGQTSICLMSTADTSALFTKISQAQPVDFSALLLLTTALTAAILFLFAPKQRRKIVPRVSSDPPVPLYTQLYSQGILNPKAP